MARAYAYPPASGQASFVRMVMLAAIADRVTPERADASEVLIGFLRTFDLGFTDRRLRFVIQGVNDAYRKDDPRLGGLDAGGRERLDTVKSELYAKLEELWEVVSPDAVKGGVGREPFGLFDEEQLAEPVRREVSPQRFVEDHRDQLNALLDRLGAYLDGELKSFPGRLWERFVTVTSGWPELQQLLLVRFLGFPVWDPDLADRRAERGPPAPRDRRRADQPARRPARSASAQGAQGRGRPPLRRLLRPHRPRARLLVGAPGWGRTAPEPGGIRLDERWYHRTFQAVLEEEGPQLPPIQPAIQEIRAKLSVQEPQPSSS